MPKNGRKFSIGTELSESVADISAASSVVDGKQRPNCIPCGDELDKSIW